MAVVVGGPLITRGGDNDVTRLPFPLRVRDAEADAALGAPPVAVCARRVGVPAAVLELVFARREREL